MTRNSDVALETRIAQHHKPLGPFCVLPVALNHHIRRQAAVMSMCLSHQNVSSPFRTEVARLMNLNRAVSCGI